jgi:endonuclease YncB( thermonuclease family)
VITPETVTVVFHGKDCYGRTIGEVLTADEPQKNLNLAMVRSDQAVVYPKYCKDQAARQQAIQTAEASSYPAPCGTKSGNAAPPILWACTLSRAEREPQRDSVSRPGSPVPAAL